MTTREHRPAGQTIAHLLHHRPELVGLGVAADMTWLGVMAA